MSTHLITIPFHGQSLITFEHEGEPHVVLRPIVEAIGLDWSAQFRRIKRHEILGTSVAILATVAQDGKQREVIGLPIKYLSGWLFGIQVNMVKPELRELILAYQRESFDVLHDHWFGKRPKPLSPEVLAQIEAQVEAALEPTRERLRAKLIDEARSRTADPGRPARETATVPPQRQARTEVDPAQHPVISRLEAAELGLRRFFTGRPCKNGHIAERLVRNGGCVICDTAYSAAYKAKFVDALNHGSRP